MAYIMGDMPGHHEGPKGPWISAVTEVYAACTHSPTTSRPWMRQFQQCSAEASPASCCAAQPQAV
jgi:hypothetical protein